MMIKIKKHWVLWLFSAVLAFSVGLLVNLPAAIAFDRINSQLPPEIAEVLSGLEGSVWNGQGSLRKGMLKSKVDWQFTPLELLSGGTGLELHLHEKDHDLQIKFDPDGKQNGRIEVSGMIDSALVNRQLALQGIRIKNDIELNAVRVAVNNDQFSEAGGSVIWKGGSVSYNSSGTKSLEMPALTGRLSTVDGELVLNIVEAGGSEPITVVTFKLDGWFGFLVKPRMADLVKLPNRRVNRAGNVMELKRKVY